MLWMVLVLALLLVLSMWRRSKRAASAEEQLKRRYAKGEIDAPTYERMLEDLRR